MVKRCQWGLCKSDTRYPERLEGGVRFIPFPKPKRNLDLCKLWIKACGRPHEQLNVNLVDGNRHMYVCTKHFPDGGPSELHPVPFTAERNGLEKCTPSRPPPKARPMSEPPRKRRKILTDEHCVSENQESCQSSSAIDAQTQTTQEPQEKHISPLDFLALAAENKEMQKKMAEQILENENLRRKLAESEEKIKLTTNKKENNRSKFNVEAVRDSPVRDNFKYYTGFTYEQFLNIFKFLVPITGQDPLTFNRTISSLKHLRMQDQLLLTLVKLRLNLEFKHIAYLFSLSPQDAGAVFRAWINYMFYRFGSVPIWPSRDILFERMPGKFKEDFPTTFVILDGTELKVERPSSLRSQSQCYSDYKSATTLKGLVGIDPRGSFIFISMLFSGSISDKEITAQSGLLSLLQQLLDTGKLKPGDGVMVDKGFHIKEEIENLGLKLYIPPFAPGAGQMTAGDVRLTKKIAAHRVHVERAISRAKTFKIVDNRIDPSLFPCINQIWFCCCFLTGFMPYLI